ncbi:MAG TPA: DUF5680 domain-containing protein [Candidatus Paceibacterota bacterium]|jgi:hypothetical protein|nr:hypothetical protein [Parcubacteria group bacterium]MDP6119432.1 DUF5680 domain-containing protein [Candidatus Paceibacterota bacterium]HJN62690.1 DUF5680 domain-containing protein [Candidatus Paceibacterota bacterium]|tara:strand:+ start:48 stop:524 length:477 start_codon:yes stop_codon:yes gene_type:complete
MFDKKELCEFLVEAKKTTYAAGDSAKKIINDDKSTTLIFESGDWKYHDNYFGGEPYGGREVVFFKGKPVYIMTYYGQVDDSVSDINKVYGILMDALKLIPGDKPYRGPEKYNNGDLSYENSFTGEVDNFFGEESISENGNEIYKARYIGGFVDVKKEE